MLLRKHNPDLPVGVNSPQISFKNFLDCRQFHEKKVSRLDFLFILV